MAKFSLLPNESIILKTERVKHGGMFAIYTDDLILTSQNLVVVCKGTFGNTKDVVRYPLNQIKMYNGEPQALLGTAQNGTPQLEVYFLNGQQEAFGFQSMGKKEITQWINAICKAVTGHESSTMSTTSAFAIDTKGLMMEDAVFDGFVCGVRLALGLTTELQHYVEERSEEALAVLPAMEGEKDED